MHVALDRTKPPVVMCINPGTWSTSWQISGFQLLLEPVVSLLIVTKPDV